MPLMPRLVSLWRNLFQSARKERELAEEVDAYLEMLIEQKIERRLTPDAARRASLLELGSKDQVKEQVRSVRMGHHLDVLWRDLRYAVRMLRRSPGFTAVALLSLALGIGANTAIFSLINALMLRLLPVENSQDLVIFRIVGPQMPPGTGYNSTYPLYQVFRDRNQSFTGVITGANVGRARIQMKESGAGVESVEQQRVSGNFFSVLGVTPVLGRTLLEADDDPANVEPGTVISYDYWKRRFGLAPDVVGRKITVNRTALTIVGVAPPEFFGFEVGTRPELWWPIRAVSDPNLSRTGSFWIRVIGRLRPGVSRAQAQIEIESLYQQQLADESARSTDWSATRRRNHFSRHMTLESGGAGYTRLRYEFRQPLFILMMTVGLVLLIACVNVANLLLARAATRRKEIAMRLALGAGRFRLLRQLLTESILLSLLGGAAGLLFARLCLRGLISFLPQQAQTSLDIAPDTRVLLFTLVVSVLTGMLFGVAPAWKATHLDLTPSLKDQTGGSTSGSRLASNRMLVVTQVALSLFLLVGAGLFVRSLRNLRTLDVGMNYDRIVQFSLDLGGGYQAQQRSDLYKRLLARLEALPGVQSATLLYFSLLGGGGVSLDVSVPGYVSSPDENVQCNVMAVGPRFFETMKMAIVAGRDFGLNDERSVPTEPQPPSDRPQALATALPQSVVINQAMARYFFGSEDPIGRSFSLKGNGQRFEIIGITTDAKYLNLREQPPRTFYPFYFQSPERGNMLLQFRTSSERVDYAATIARVARELEPQAQVVGLRMMSDVVDQSLMQERFIAQTAGAFSLFALMLACVGMFGVMSYAVTRRTNEIGIRVALGAQTRDVVWLVMREVMVLVGLGAGIGLAAALATTRLVSPLLYDVTPNDPLTLALATLLMFGVAALAGYIPARRASHVDPLLALRRE